jgi:hypothetical protein
MEERGSNSDEARVFRRSGLKLEGAEGGDSGGGGVCVCVLAAYAEVDAAFGMP